MGYQGTVPDTYADTCFRAAQLFEQGRYAEAYDLHRQYKHKATRRGDKGWSCDCHKCVIENYEKLGR